VICMQKSIRDTLINDITNSGSYTPKTLAHNWTHAVYTDGCKSEVTDPISGHQNIIIGAACYDAHGAKTKDGGQLYFINPNGCRETNTITRAELSAIHQALIIKKIMTLMKIS